MKLDIIYRCCNAEVDGNFKWIRPNFFDKIKCLNTFLESVDQCNDIIDNIVFLHDGPKGRLYDNIPKKFKIIEVDYKDNEKSLIESFKIANNLNNHIYFVEDDYLHLKKSINTIYNGILNFKLVTGYDHLDRYTRTDDFTIGKEYVAFSKKTNSHWRTCESTCCTWACTRELWNSEMKEAAYKFKLQDRELFRFLVKEKNIRLWNPIPGVITQVDNNLSPGIDWEKI